MKKPSSIISSAAAVWDEVKTRTRSLRRRDVYLWIGGLLVIGAALAVLLVKVHVNWNALSEGIGRLNPVLVIVGMALLPLVGFSISIVYLAVGARFGPVDGFFVVSGVTAFHLLATYWIARSFLRAPLERLVKKRGYRLPSFRSNEHAGICLLAVLVPGLPYIVRNYLLVLTDVPLRIYLSVCIPAYVARSYVTILLGDMTNDPNGTRLVLLVVFYVLKLLICAGIVLHLKRGWSEDRQETDPSAVN